MNELDLKALTYLSDRGRATWSELSSVLGLSAPSTADRVRKLEEEGVIRGYHADIEPASVGCILTAFVMVVLEHPRHRPEFLARVAELACVQECHHITGDYDYLLKIRCRSTQDLELLLSDALKGGGGVIRSHTAIALSTVKETTRLPIMPNMNLAEKDNRP